MHSALKMELIVLATLFKKKILLKTVQRKSVFFEEIKTDNTTSTHDKRKILSRQEYFSS